MRHVVKEFCYIRINNYSHFLFITGIPYRLYSIVSTTFLPEAIRKIIKINLIDSSQKHCYCSLQYLIFKGWNSNWTLTFIFLLYPYPLHRGSYIVSFFVTATEIF
ncbi:MAG: hypothetical protein MAG431_01812 [Chloroflexi bacterium]|nr:hypothetical protein [Chloroflexota bacterium]